MSLEHAAVVGVKWGTFSQIAQQVLALVTLFFLAHLLPPSNFGLLEMATVVIGFIILFRDLGMSAAVIQRKHVSEELLASVFWINVTLSIIVTLIISFFSSIVAMFFDEGLVAPILVVLSITLIISSVGVLPESLLRRNLEFDKIAIVNLSATIAGSIIGIGSALLGAGVWSLVLQVIVIRLTTTIFLWMSKPWKVTLTFSWDEIKSISSYSLNLVGFNTFNYFTRNADSLLIGKFLGAQALGYYSLAYRLMLFPIRNISSTIGRVMFPIYSKLQENKERFRKAVLEMEGTIAFITFPMMLGLMFVIDYFVLVFYGNQWTPVIIIAFILSPIGMIQSLYSPLGSIYMAKDRTDLFFLWGSITSVLSVIAIVIGLQWGITGVALLYAFVVLTLTIPTFLIPLRLINLRSKELIKALWRPFLCSSLMVFVVMIFRFILPTGISNELVLIVLTLLGFSTYFLTSWTLNKNQIHRNIKRIIGEEYPK